MKNKVNDELKQHFRPEFLNRIDDIIVFHQLTEDEIVADRRPDDRAGSTTQLRNKDMGIELTDAAKELLAKKGYDPVLGARPLRRTIQREIEDALSREDPVRRARSPARSWSSTSRAGRAEVDDQGRTKPAPESAKFTFRGEPKPTPVPDTPRGRDGGNVGRGGQLMR